jgi:hypothetical protein
VGRAGIVREVAIRSLGEFVDRVTPEAPDPRIGRRRDTGIYRGASDADAPLLTSLDRLGGTEPPHAKADLEEHILRNYVRYSRPYLGREGIDDWEHLISAQHHGVPTRLLDWTYSPLVAAFFATRPLLPERDRVVWRLDWMQVHEKFGFPALAMLTSDLDAMFGMEGHFTPWRLFARSPDEPPFACLLEPPSLDQRIVVQAAAFTLCSDKTRAFDEFLARQGLASALMRFVIPAAEVGRLRDQLDLVGVDERRLFPDLDGVADAIQRYYA